MEEITDCTMQDIHGGLPLDGDSLKRKRDETKEGSTTGEQQYHVEGEPVVAKPRLENSEPVENELTDSCGEVGQSADPIMGGEGVGDSPEKIESKVDAGDQEHVTADSKEKEEQVNAQGGEQDVEIDKEMDSEISEDGEKMTGKKEPEENGQIDAPGNDEGEKRKHSSDDGTLIDNPIEVEGFEEKKVSETCGEPMEVEGFTEKKESGQSGEPMEEEDSKVGGDHDRTVETEERRKDNIGEPCSTEADELMQAEGSQLVSRNNLEVEKDAKENTGEPCKPQADEITQAGATKEDEELPESKVEVEGSRREDKTETDKPTQGEDLLEFPGNKVELEQSRKEETGKSFDVEAEKLRQAEDSEVPVENIETGNNSTQEDTEDLRKTEGDKLTQVEGSQVEEILDTKVETDKSKEENTGEARKAEIDELTQTDASPEVSTNKVEIQKSTKENVEENSETEVKNLPQAEDSREEVQEVTMDTDKSTKEDTVESGMTAAAEPTGVGASEEKGPREVQAGNDTEDTGESSVEEALKPMGAQGLEKKEPGQEEAGNETSSVVTGKLPLTEVHKITDSGVLGSLEKHAESREEPLVADDSVEEKHVECESNLGTSTEEDRHQSSGKLHAEGSVKVEDSQNESHSTEEPMEVELFSEKEEANERSVNIEEGKEDVITSPMELEHVRAKDEDTERVAIVLKVTDDVILGPMDVEPSKEKEDGTEGMANAQTYTEDVIAGPMDLGYSSGKEDAKEVKKFEEGTDDATAGPMEVHQFREKEVTKETTEVEKGTEDVIAAPLEAEQTKEVQHPKTVGQDPKEEAAVKKSTEDVPVGPGKEADLKTQFATDAEQEHAVKSGEEKGVEEEALDSQKEETEGKEATIESSDEKSEIGTDRDAMSSPTPTPTRRKPGRRSVAAKAAERQKDFQKAPRNPERVELLKKMETLEDMKKLLAEHGRSEKDYKVGDIIEVDDLLQTDYEYKLEAPIGKGFAEGFTPRFSPKEMLELGIFEGKVINDCVFEFPKEWYEGAVEKEKLCPQGPDDSVNQFKVKSRLPSKEGRKKGWLPRKDPHGWFQWYCRYYLGRRLEPDDSHQMSRWRQMRRQAGQIKKYCEPGDLSCRAKQRQTLLNWSHDCFM